MLTYFVVHARSGVVDSGPLGQSFGQQALGSSHGPNLLIGEVEPAMTLVLVLTGLILWTTGLMLLLLLLLLL